MHRNMKNSCKEVEVLIKKFRGILVGSAAAAENGIDVIPRDSDVVFGDETQEMIAVLWLLETGWRKTLIEVPREYMRDSRIVWRGQMVSLRGEKLDLFIGEVRESCDGIATNMCVLRAHVRKIQTWEAAEACPYVQKLLKAIAC